MPEPELVRVGPDQWETFRDVRLASLADAPGAFGASYADWVDAAEQRWRARLTDVPFTVVALSDGRGVGVVSGAQADDHVELISMWVAPGHRGTGLAERPASGGCGGPRLHTCPRCCPRSAKPRARTRTRVGVAMPHEGRAA